MNSAENIWRKVRSAANRGRRRLIAAIERRGKVHARGLSLTPHALKIDVDGAEGRVLSGDVGLQPEMHELLRQADFSRVAMSQRSEVGNELWMRSA